MLGFLLEIPGVFFLSLVLPTSHSLFHFVPLPAYVSLSVYLPSIHSDVSQKAYDIP